jgi:hypothetical protein
MALLVSGAIAPAGRIIGMVAYVTSRIFNQRREGRTWSEVWADGGKPITGNVWLDGLVFLLVLLALAGVVLLLVFV